MIIQLRQLFEIDGQAIDIDESISVQELSEAQPYESFAAPVEIKGRAQNRVGVVTLSFTVRAKLSQICDRCSEAFDREYVYDFEHTLARSLSDDGDEYDDYVVCPDNTLDLSELALSDLKLALPTKILCREDCEGLCAHCGKNLNEGSCDCEY